MEHLEYPKWKYQGAKGVIVNNEQEEAELGDGWTDAPSDAADEPTVDPRDVEIAVLREQLAKAQAEAAGKSTTSAKKASN